MVKVHDEPAYVRHHRQKIVLALSVTRHFAKAFRSDGLRVDYVRLDNKRISGSYTGDPKEALSRYMVD